MLPSREVSGVHEAQTEPAPYLDEEDRVTEEHLMVGSLPVSAIGVQYEPVVCVESGETVGHEVSPTCDAEGLHGADDLFARALFEHRIGELCRVLRDHALTGARGAPLFIDVHAQELKEGLLIRPDDPMALSESPLYLQLSQSTFSSVCMHVLEELRGRGEVALVIDGVGAGESNLLQLIELSPRLVKLSPQLTAGFDRDARRRAVVHHVSAMCASLGCGVVARDVKTRDELAVLVDCGVSYVQGPLLGIATDAPTAGTLPG